MSDVIVSTTDTETSTAATSGAPASGSATDQPAAITKVPAETSTASGAEQTEPKDKEEKSEDDDEGDLAADQNDPAKKPQKGAEKRIKKLIGRATAAELERDALKVELEKARAGKETKPIETKTEANVNARPNADDFKTHDEYVDALTDWKIDQRDSQNETKATKKAELEKVTTAYKAGEKSAKEKYPDYDEVVNECETGTSDTVLNLLFSSENGSELAYLLAKNEPELERISKLSPVAAARALGRFEALHIKASESQESTEPKTTKAPPPISTVGSSRSANATKHPDDMTYDEFKAWREQKKG